MKLAEHWAELRAALLFGVVSVHLVAAAPLPHVVTSRDLRDPVAKEEVARWSERLTALGYVITPEALGERVMEVTGVVGGGHRAVLSPVRPWFRFTGTGQGWALFANPDTHPSRLDIRVQRGAHKELVYQRGDATHRQWARLVESRRLRPIYDAEAVRRKPNNAYRRYVDWVSREIRAEDPSISAVELTVVEMHTAPRGEKRRKPKPRHTVRSP